MSGKNETQEAPGPTVVRSGGEDASHGYVEAEVPGETHSPTMEMDRVQVTDPRRAPTVRRGDMFKGAGPRAPEQTVLRAAKAPGIEAPMGRPATKMQVLVLDEEFRDELRRKRAELGGGGEEEGAGAAEAGESGGAGEEEKGEEDKGEAKPASPWTKDAGEPVRAGALPASIPLREQPAPAGEEPAGEGARGRSKSTAAMIALAVVAVAVGLRALMTAKTTENGSQGPAPTATMTAAVPAVMPPVMPSAGATAIPSAASPSIALSATPTAVPSAAAMPKSTTARGALPAVPPDPYEDAAIGAPSSRPIVPAPTSPAVAPGLPGGDKTEF
jgi:hypothetical protein